MRRWLRLAAGLYPWSWRERYGVEFQALLEDVNPGWREFTDVLRGALKMQMTNATTYLKLAGGLAVVGAIVATAVSFSFPRIYQSTAVIRVAEPQNPQRAASTVSQDALQEHVTHQLLQIEQEVLSRTSLEGLITQPRLDLYREARTRDPMEDIVQRMRNRDIRIYTANAPHGVTGTGRALAISFSSPDQQKAQAVVRALTTQFIDQNMAANRFEESAWQKVWPQSVPPPLGPDLEVLDPRQSAGEANRREPDGIRGGGADIGTGAGPSNGCCDAAAEMEPEDGRLRGWRLRAGSCGIVPAA
jgi:hypothetical protein